MSNVNIYALAKNDRDGEENGKWFEDVLYPGSGISFKLRRTNSASVRRVMSRKLQENRGLMKKGKFADDVDRRLFIETLAEAVIVDWKGVVVEEGGEEIPYSVEAAEKLLTDLPNLLEWVQLVSGNMVAFLAEAAEEVSGN